MDTFLSGKEIMICGDYSEKMFSYFDFTLAPALLYYIYIPLFTLLILLSYFILKKEVRSRKTIAVSGVSLSLASWVFFSIMTWSALPVALVHFSWQVSYLFEILFFIFVVYLAYLFYAEKDMPAKFKWIIFFLSAPVFLLASTPLLLEMFDITNCESVPGVLTYYVFFLQFLTIFFVGYFTFIAGKEKLHSYKDKKKTETFLLLSGLLILVVFFSLMLFISATTGIWEYESIGLIGAFILLVILGYSIARYQTFDLKVAGAEFFIIGILLLLFSMLFVRDVERLRYVILITFLLTSIIGFMLAKSVRNEMETIRKAEQLTRYLANANARLREIDKQKTEFVSVASHQLRGPIAAIKGYASMLTDGSFGAIPTPMEEPLGRILESGKRIALMVDDFLNVTRIEQGRMNYAMERHNLCDLVMSAIQELQILGEKKGLSFVFNCGEIDSHKNPVWIIGDEGKLQQVFSNIVDNAIKYTPEGSITFSLRILSDHNAINISIKDTGIGIPKEDQEKLFHKFNRASNANEATVYGTGLGLYIAKEIIKAHNGWIHISSEGKGKGTEFTIELPLAPIEKESEKTEREEKESEKKRIHDAAEKKNKEKIKSSDIHSL
jgi:signal transduction histidine kinase